MEVAGKVVDVLVGAPINNKYILNIDFVGTIDVEEDTTAKVGRRPNET